MGGDKQNKFRIQEISEKKYCKMLKINRSLKFETWRNQSQAVLDLGVVPSPYLFPLVLGAFLSLLGWVEYTLKEKIFFVSEISADPPEMPLWGQRGPP